MSEPGDISQDRRFQPVLDALIRLHGSYKTSPEMRSLERGQVAEFLVMFNAANAISTGDGNG